ncbi:MAG: hypothetical protein Q9162_006038 [Coniocarpon cinnabarinum]
MAKLKKPKDIHSVVPAHLQYKEIENEKLFCLIAALEHQKALNGELWKLAASYSDEHFSAHSLVYTMKEWRKAAWKMIHKKGREVAEETETPVQKKRKAAQVEQDANEKGNSRVSKKTKGKPTSQELHNRVSKKTKEKPTSQELTHDAENDDE